MSKTNSIIADFSRNGSPKKKTKAPKKKVAASTMATWRQGATIGLGVAIPGLTFYLSWLGATYLPRGGAETALGVGAFGTCILALCLSLSHLAWAVGDITGSGKWSSLAMGGAIDLALIWSDIAIALGNGSVGVYAAMAAITAASMFLNCWAFLLHKPSGK